MVLLKGWRYIAFLTCIAGGCGLALYPIIIQPMINPKKYKEIQEITRAGINQEDIQPGNMKVWSDPFSPKQ